MVSFNEIMKIAVFEYISNHPERPTPNDITIHFDLSLNAVIALENEGKIQKVWTGHDYGYEVI